QSLLRKWLVENGYAIVDEALAREGNRFYEIITVTHGTQHVLEDVYYEIGYMLIKKKDPLLMDFIQHKIDKTVAIISHLEGQNTESSNETAKAFRRKLSQYKEVYRWLLR